MPAGLMPEWGGERHGYRMEVVRGVPEHLPHPELIYSIVGDSVDMRTARPGYFDKDRRGFIAQELSGLEAWLDASRDLDTGATEIRFIIYDDGDWQTTFTTPQRDAPPMRSLVRQALQDLPSRARTDASLRRMRRGEETRGSAPS